LNQFLKRFFCFLILCSGCLSIGLAQTAQDGFGKNRIQYKRFEWQYFSSNSVDVFFYDGGEKLSKTVTEIAEAEFKRISDLFGATPNSKIKVFLYLSTNDRLMSNVGLGDNSVLTGGKTNFTKSTAEVAYEGSLLQLRRQISAGIAQILIRDMLFGGSFKDAVQNTYLLTLPDWFIGGAIKFASEGWSSELDDFVRDINFSRRVRQPANYVGKDAYLIGHSIWNYVAERYGRSNIGNILNLTRIIRNEENAISGTLGMPFPTFLRDWKNFYQSQNQVNEGFLNVPPKNQRLSLNLLKKNYRQLAVTRDGSYIVYAQNWKGKFQIVSQNVATRKSHVIFRGGSKAIHQNSDGEYPILCLDSDNNIWCAYPHHGTWKGLKMNIKGSDRISVPVFSSFNEVYSICISPNGRHLAISASSDGYSDIYLANTSSYKISRLTNDWFDDLNPVFKPGGDTILFSSNRGKSDSTISDKAIPDHRRKYNLYELDARGKSAPILWYENGSNLTRPTLIGSEYVVCLSDEPGVTNLVGLEKVNRVVTRKYLSSSKFSIQDYAYQLDFKLFLYSLQIRLKPQLYLDPVFEEVPMALPSKEKLDLLLSGADSVDASKSVRGTIRSDSNYIDIRNYVFEEEKASYQVSANQKTKKNERVKLKREPKPLINDITGPFPYLPRVTANYLTTGLVVDPIPSWGLGALVDFSMHDLFENHRINGGMTYFFTDMEMRNNNAFLEYQFLKRRVDFKVKVERRSIQNSSYSSTIRQRDILYGITPSISYPLSNALRVEFSPYFQSTQRSLFDNNAASNLLQSSDFFVYYWGVKSELVFDNTTTTGMNMITGTRFKVRGQYQAANQLSNRSFGELFVDFRTYQPIHNEIVFAFRATYGNFFGAAPKKYLLGGMDNWLFRSYEVSAKKDDPLRGLNQTNQIIVSEEAQSDWLFNRYATNLRGFKYNNIYGNSFLLFNWELRVPIIRYFYKGPINSNFWRNLQLTGFTDMGTAWTGVGPFQSDNSLNTTTITNGNFLIKVKSFDNPFLVGYGFGARTMVLGYYLKFDMAWGRRNGITDDPKYYFTFGYDF
jgi:hypothetical protein